MEILCADHSLINKEYRIWKHNIPLLYDFVFNKAQKWPSMTCQWLPGKLETTQGDYSVEKLILGTHTSNGEQNHLMIAEARIPKDSAESDSTKKGRDGDASGGYNTGNHDKIKIMQKINHDGEVHRAQYMSQNSFIIATNTIEPFPFYIFCVESHNNPTCFFFDTSRHHFKPRADGKCNPKLRLKGHKKERYGVSQSPSDEGKILSGAYDKLICMWDIQSSNIRTGGYLDPIGTYEGHTNFVEDVAWHKFHSDIFSSVGDHRKLLIWDTRARDRKKPLHKVKAHRGYINCVCFNPFSEFFLATGSADRSVALWDMINMNLKVHSYENHVDEILQVDWSPFSETLLASGCADRQINVWDLEKIGEDQDPDCEIAWPPELLLIHSGHTNKVSDVLRSRNKPWLLPSVAEDNILQLWAIAENIYDEEYSTEKEKKVDTDN